MVPPAPPAPSAPPRPPARRPLRRLLPVALAALLGACQDLGPERAHVTVRYREVAPLHRTRLVLTLTDSARQWYVEGLDLVDGEEGWLVGRDLRTAAAGRLLVRLAMRGEGASPVASGDALLPLSPGGHWRVDVFPSSRSPAEVCDGCAGLRRIPIAPEARPSAQDWLYLTWTAVALPPPA